MAKPVVLTPIAKSDLENISDWLAEKWSLTVLGNFLDLYQAKINLSAVFSSRYPFLYNKSLQNSEKQFLPNITSFFIVKKMNILKL